MEANCPNCDSPDITHLGRINERSIAVKCNACGVLIAACVLSERTEAPRKIETNEPRQDKMPYRVVHAMKCMTFPSGIGDYAPPLGGA